MRIYVVSFQLESDQERDHECYLTARSARIRKDELEAAAAHYLKLEEERAHFVLHPQVRTIDIPCNAEGLIAAIEGRWLKYQVRREAT